MVWLNRKFGKPHGEIRVPQLRFLGEQMGLPERELNTRLAEFFGHNQDVMAAYLARIAYGEKSPVAVALCIRIQFEPNHRLTEEIGKIFASMFGGHEHLDIIFLDDQQESELAKVCSPFFDNAMRAGRTL